MTVPLIQIEKEGRPIFRMRLSVLTFFNDDRLMFHGWPVEISVTLPSGHTEKWTEQEPDDGDEEEEYF